jgi:hypothetical protein
MRRTGWFVAGVATAVGAIAAGEVARRRLRGDAGDELPPAVGFERAMATADDVVEAPTMDVPMAAQSPPGTDARAEELRAKIAESRERLHAKARAGSRETEGGAAEPRPQPEAEPGPEAG